MKQIDTAVHHAGAWPVDDLRNRSTPPFAMVCAWAVDDLGSKLTPLSAMAGAWVMDYFRSRLKGGSARASWGERRDRGDQRQENEGVGARFVEGIGQLIYVSATLLPHTCGHRCLLSLEASGKWSQAARATTI